MTGMDIFRELGGLDAQLVMEAAPTERPPRRAHKITRWAAIAACACLLVAGGIRLAIAFIPSRMEDSYREGETVELEDPSLLPAAFPGKLLAYNMQFDRGELYYKSGGADDMPETWYSLLLSKQEEDRYITLYCMFNETDVERWKVSMVFTEEATQVIDINGVSVQLAEHPMAGTLDDKYWYYAIFEYDSVVYDLRIKSDRPDAIYEVLHELIRLE